MSGLSHWLQHRSRIALLSAISITGIALSVAGYWILTSKENRLLRAQLEADAEQRGRAVERRFRTDVLAVFGLSPFVNERGAGTREDFRRLTDGILGSNPDLASLIWIPRVRAGQRAAHEAAMRTQGLPQYHVKPWGPPPSVPDLRATAMSSPLPLWSRADATPPRPDSISPRARRWQIRLDRLPNPGL